MGLSKANELLLLGKRIDAKTAVDWNICSRMIELEPHQNGADPFSNHSLAHHVCNELNQLLLSLPLSDKTTRVFISLIRGQKQRIHRMQQICRNELKLLDQRGRNGDVLLALHELTLEQKRSSKL